MGRCSCRRWGDVIVAEQTVLVIAHDMGWAYWALGPALLVLSGLTVACLEKAQPQVVAWNVDAGDLGVDMLHLAGNFAVSHLSLAAFSVLRQVWPGVEVWPQEWSFWSQAIVAILIFDLGLYVVHRASHGLGWLWRLHSIHHSPRRVYWMNGQRRHLMHELIEGAPGLAVLFVAGAPTATVLVAVAVVTLHLLLQHANIAYRVGPLGLVFAVADSHRWHHQRLWRDVQGNYGAVFSFWDRLFGTALRKRGDAPADVGMDDEPDLPSDYLGQLRWPFTKRRTA